MFFFFRFLKEIGSDDWFFRDSPRRFRYSTGFVHCNCCRERVDTIKYCYQSNDMLRGFLVLFVFAYNVAVPHQSIDT